MHVYSSGSERVDSESASKASRKNKSAKYQNAAITAWTEQLTDADFDIEQWPAITKKTQPQHIFDVYTQKLSDIFLENKANVNFMLIGACDGTHDKTIRDRFIPNSNWNGIFIEPISLNYKDLNIYLETNQLMNRSITIQAAATDKCVGPNITLKVANFEKKNPNAPHWLRREINSILRSPQEALDPDWVKEGVPCKTASDIMQDWTVQYYQRQPKIKRRIEPRIHVLKIDAEGHDFEVLSSFLRPDVAPEALPLLICFEAKGLVDRLPLARELMINKGYVVSEGITNDGFAILRSNATVTTTTSSKKKSMRSKSDGQSDNGKEKKGGKKRRRKSSSGDHDSSSSNDNNEGMDRSGRDEKRGSGKGGKGGRKRNKGGKKEGRGKGSGGGEGAEDRRSRRLLKKESEMR